LTAASITLIKLDNTFLNYNLGFAKGKAASNYILMAFYVSGFSETAIAMFEPIGGYWFSTLKMLWRSIIFTSN
jgi:hypothetical protein